MENIGMVKHDEIINKPILKSWMLALVDSVKKIFISIFHSSPNPFKDQN